VVRTGADFDEESFQAWYGPIAALSPAQVAELFAGSEIRWAVVGGRAARVAASQTRHHEDTDVEVPLAQLPALRDHLADWHLWQNEGGALRPLLPDDELRDGVNQLWLRRDSRSPWLLDLLLVPGDGTEWVYRPDERVRLPWSRAHRVVDGVRYVRPEIALLFKANSDRPKDRADLAAARLDTDGRAWLVARLRELGLDTWADLAAKESRWRDLRL
jgi:hypothetical protein